MVSCMRKIYFCYGHRVMGHEHKCATLHGHNATVEIHALPLSGLDSVGRVIDFSIIKEKVGGWIEQNWDHTMILYREDRSTVDLINQAPKLKEVYILDSNPTSENLAKHLFWEVCPQVLADCGVMVNKVVFWETENCNAVEYLEPDAPELKKLYA